MCEDRKREWGFYDVLSDEEDHKVKRITVYPGKRLSLQKHMKRAEHWFIVFGSGLVTLNDNEFSVNSGDSVNIEMEDLHRIKNTADSELVFIEVQTGSYFGEDDIIRLQDDYGRI